MLRDNINKERNFLPKKIIIIGSFPSNINIGGAVIKNKILYQYLVKYFNDKFNCSSTVRIVDVSQWRKRPIYVALKIIKEIICPPCFILLSAATRSALTSLYFIVPFSKIFKHNIKYLVVGGTLPGHINKKPNLIKRLNKVDKIYVESKIMKKNINDLGLNNVFYLPNFRYYEYIPSLNKVIHTPYKLVFFSRVTKDKGIELAIEAIRFINEEFRSIKFTLDIYGPVEEDCKELIENIGAQEKYITYKGVLDPNNDKLYETLSQYDVMIFPTYWHGEGFPGAIIDAYISGLPVIASDWNYNSEIVINEVTGKLFTAKNKQSLIYVLEWFLRNPGTIVDMSKNCIEEAKKYHVDNVLPQLIKDLDVYEVDKNEGHDYL